MRPFALTIACVLLIATACAPRHQHVRALWTKDAGPPADLVAPAGFAVTPPQALAAARESRMLSLKPRWHVYADSRYYYIVDAFTGSSARAAYHRGLRINGQTGEVVPR